jgi:hypothetical protein
MLWDAGRQRTERESRDRLAELYVGVRDGWVAGKVQVGEVKWIGAAHVPSYARPEAAPVRSAEAQRATLARLGAMFPGTVRRGDS